ncbi:Uncharacterised protein [Bacteroides heparinolyticus]|uniref:Uncharacterized protein n=1 Tax=Prevotella heparinolytica TaxID=28113 RepID=A0A449I4T4_9BACE|nr:Uncharacterised protein [Bacteroides heparinolyticus]
MEVNMQIRDEECEKILLGRGTSSDSWSINKNN